MNGLKRGWAIARESVAVLRLHPRLLIFPLLSVIAILVILAGALPVALYEGKRPAFVALDEDTRGWVVVAQVLVVYVACYFVAIFFNAALIACVIRCFETGTASIADGLKAATHRIGAIFCWAVVAGTVGLLIKAGGDALSRQAEKDLGFLAAIIVGIIVGILYMIWIAVSYFVLPVLVMEGVGPFTALKRSSSLIEARWKDVVGGEARFGLLGLLLLLPLVILVPILAVAFDAAGIVIGIGFTVVYIAVVGVVLSTMGTIFLAAVYKFAATGDVPEAFSAELVQTALRTKAA